MAGAALARVAQLWSLLDEMAENEPQAYRRLLRQQRAEAERLCAPPEPHLCLRTRLAVGARGLGLGLLLECWERVQGRLRGQRGTALGGRGGGAFSRSSVSCRALSGLRCSSTSAAGKGSRRPRPPLIPHLSVQGR